MVVGRLIEAYWARGFCCSPCLYMTPQSFIWHKMSHAVSYVMLCLCLWCMCVCVCVRKLSTCEIWSCECCETHFGKWLFSAWGNVSCLMFSIIEGPPLQQWSPARFVRKWVMTTRSADYVACRERDVIFLFGNWWMILGWFYCKYKNKKAWDVNQWMPVAVMRSSMPLAWVVYYGLLTIVHKLLPFLHRVCHMQMEWHCFQCKSCCCDEEPLNSLINSSA